MASALPGQLSRTENQGSLQVSLQGWRYLFHKGFRHQRANMGIFQLQMAWIPSKWLLKKRCLWPTWLKSSGMCDLRPHHHPKCRIQQVSLNSFKFSLFVSTPGLLFPLTWLHVWTIIHTLGVKDVAGVIQQRFLLIEHWLILRRIIA